jgi:D-beta-D-heptose 7-phosphate kinase/D-beta-D-heptose 1-phosphate adenosyltransferase
MDTVLKKFKSFEEIVRLRETMRKSGKRLVFTNGCFDILHVGHVRYLNRARALGDRLVVALNSDRSVRQIKGKSRPVVPEMERAEVLAALESVDYIFLFDDLTPQGIIDALLPDVLVKGSDWEVSRVVGRDAVERAGGSVLTVPIVEGSSTTGIIRKVMDRFGSSS